MTTARNATPAHQRLDVRKKTMTAMIAAGTSAHMIFSTRMMRTIPTMIRAAKPRSDIRSMKYLYVNGR